MEAKIVDPLAWVRSSEERFFPGGGVDSIRLLAYVMADVLVLGGGECRIVRRDGWSFVVSDSDWLHHQTISLHGLFQQVVPAPAHGEHSLRAEVIVNVYAQDVFTARDSEEHVIKGSPPSNELVRSLVAPGHRILAFRLR